MFDKIPDCPSTRRPTDCLRLLLILCGCALLLMSPREANLPLADANQDGAPTIHNPVEPRMRAVTGAGDAPSKAAPAAELIHHGSFASLNAAFSAARYAAESIDPTGPHSRGANIFAANPRQQLRVWFRDDGAELASGHRSARAANLHSGSTNAASEWTLALRLTGSGRAGALTVPGKRQTRHRGSRVEIVDPISGLTEWYENRPEGLEHGFTLQRPPGLADSASNNAPLEVVISVHGNLRPRLTSSGGSGGPPPAQAGNSPADAPSGVRFLTGDDDREILDYSGVKAWDATGRILPAKIELKNGSQTRLAMVVDDRGAQYPVTIDPLFTHLDARLTEDATERNDGFGQALALEGNTAVIGALYDASAAGPDSGSVYVFSLVEGNWVEEAKLTAPESGAFGYFGASVAINGNTILVGAPEEEVGTGRAYVFARDESAWHLQAKLTASDAAPKDAFGKSVVLFGETALVGASMDDTLAGEDAGSAYFFKRSGTQWTQQTKISAADGAKGSHFGFSVSLRADRAIIGAPNGSTLFGKTGVAYSYISAGAGWVREAKLEQFEGAGASRFGYSVALDGPTALIGAPNGDTPAGQNPGNAFVFVRDQNTWRLEAKIAGDGAGGYDGFGTSVALSGNTALAAAPNSAARSVKEAPGCVYVFQRSDGNWTPGARLTASINQASRFAPAVALHGSTAVISAVDLRGFGYAYGFVGSGISWSQAGRIETASAFDRLGTSVALHEQTAVVGAPFDDGPAGIDTGCAYIFTRAEDGWINEAKITASSPASGDHFGSAVALDGQHIIAGASGADSAAGLDSGAAFIFARSAAAWTRQAKLTSGLSAFGTAFGSAVAIGGGRVIVGGAAVGIFAGSGSAWSEEAAVPLAGTSVAISDDTAIIGVPGEDSHAGTAYVLARSGSDWAVQTRLLAADRTAYSDFGQAVALQGNTVLVGAPKHDLPQLPNAGACYVFARREGAWFQQSRLTAREGSANDGLGMSLALDGDMGLIGAPFRDSPPALRVGAAYVFTREGAIWTERQRADPGPGRTTDDYFGGAVALRGSTALIGASSDNSVGPDSGAVYVLTIGASPEVTSHPRPRITVPGASVTFSATFQGHAPLTYYWRKDGVPIDGATAAVTTTPFTASLPIAAVRPEDAGSYDIVVSNLGGSTTSAPAMLTVNTLSDFLQIRPGALPAADGSLIVNIAPPGIGAAWRFVGEHTWRQPGVSVGGLVSGDWKIEFRPIAGYLHPTQDIASIESGRPTLVIRREYFRAKSAASAAITVVLEPDYLTGPSVPIDTRAQWRFLGDDDTEWRDSGTTASALQPGSYLVECKPVPGRDTPPPQMIGTKPGETTFRPIRYFMATTVTGAPAEPLPFEAVNASSSAADAAATSPYAFVGQIRSETGSATGFLVKDGVVATAAHVVFDPINLRSASLANPSNSTEEFERYAPPGLQWLFQRHAREYEPMAQVPRGFYMWTSYSAQREAEEYAGESRVETQNLDVAALYFPPGALPGRNGYSGFLASDEAENEWLTSSRNKTLVGYPVDGVDPALRGRMHATPPSNVRFAHQYGHIYATADISSRGGASGGPLCVEFDDGKYYPAGIYLGASRQSLVRAIDSAVIELFELAQRSSESGENHTGTGITHVNAPAATGGLDMAAIQVFLSPGSAVASGARWKLATEPRASGELVPYLQPASYTVHFQPVPGYRSPSPVLVSLKPAAVTTVRATYQPLRTVPEIVSRSAIRLVRGQPAQFQFETVPPATKFLGSGLAGSGLSLNSATGLLSGRPVSPGPLTLLVTACNAAGSSAPFELNVEVLEPGELVVQANAPSHGSVLAHPTRPENIYGQGDNVSLTARPAGPRFLAAGWIVEGAVPNAISHDKLSFTMSERVVVTARFVPNQFLSATGTYEGILRNDNGDPAGAFMATLSRSGVVSGRVVDRNGSRAFRGRLDPGTLLSGAIEFATGASISLELLIDDAAPAARLSSALVVSAENLTGSAIQSIPMPADSTSGEVRHTLAFSRVCSDAAASMAPPVGHGYAIARVDGRGRLRVAGRLGDGTPFTKSGTLFPNQKWEVFLQPYSFPRGVRGKGFVAGSIFFKKITAVGAAEPSFSAPNAAGAYDLVWRRAPETGLPGGAYRAGFEERLQVQTSAYLPPAPGSPVLLLPSGNLIVGPPDAPFVQLAVALNGRNQFTFPATAVSSSMRLSTATGLFSGRLAIQTTQGIHNRPFKGVLLQNSNAGRGLLTQPQEQGCLPLNLDNTAGN